ncbi:DMT family transporter [Streptomyces sp. TRM68367]|uniref:DMT family transporter n=1 Tax=Streptomyces sp. TRM68367 TaxID=2758415 RepID=UPI00165AD8C0|nr:DMT family transporter [Streptomyces sp. TRM68367]MBC9723509.1 DMT family transporter [Streptomyces sp. TRM68367]
MPVAVLASLAAGVCFAVAGVLQQWAAAARPDAEALSLRLLTHLVRDRLWLCGIGLAVLAYGFQSLALAFGPLSLVQPLIVAELIFAVPLSARLHRMRLGRREWFGTLAVAAGLALALASARPHGGRPGAAGALSWLLLVGAVAALVCGALAAARALPGPWRASATALAAGAVMGTQSVLLAATVDRLRHGLDAALAAWQTYALVVASVGGLLLIQSAFQQGPLAASMTVLDATEPVVAVTVGMAVFGETVHAGWPVSTVTALGLALVGAGIVSLDSSPVIAALHGRGAGVGQAGAERGEGEAKGRTDEGR